MPDHAAAARYLIRVSAARTLVTEEELVAEAKARGVQRIALVIDVSASSPECTRVHGAATSGPRGDTTTVLRGDDLRSTLLALLAEIGVTK